MPTNPDREKELIKRAKKGESYAFDALIGEYYMTMYKMAYKYIQNKEAAEDITQNACIKLVRALDTFKFQSAFTSWLYTLVINTAKDWIKSQARHKSESGQINIQADDSSSNEDVHYAQQVMEQIERLPKKEREALILVTIEGLPHAKAAEDLKCSEGTISWRVHEARKKLKEWSGQS